MLVDDPRLHMNDPLSHLTGPAATAAAPASPATLTSTMNGELRESTDRPP